MDLTFWTFRKFQPLIEIDEQGVVFEEACGDGHLMSVGHGRGVSTSPTVEALS